MGSRRALSFLAVIGALGLFLEPIARTQTSTHPVVARFAGTYESPRADAGAEVIRAAIEAGVEPMQGVRRNAARRRLLSSSPPIPRITIAPHGEGVRIHYEGSARDNRTPRLGVFVTTAATGGGSVEVRHQVVGPRLHETYRESRGGAVHRFSSSPSGRELVLEASITSRFLPGPIEYRLEFVRVRS
jgi:hypothetical protein